MTVRRRQCRAVACPRRVDNRILFCNVHWPQLTPRLQQPIVDNREAPALAQLDTRARVLSGTAAAVQYLARKEGRGAQLKQAQAAAASTPATGVVAGGTDTDTSGGSTGVDRYDRRFDINDRR
jgi:hypothetical protein